MELKERLTSFPVIAGAALLVAIVLGLVFGLGGPKAQVLPQDAQSEGESFGEQGGVKAGQFKADGPKVGKAGKDDGTPVKPRDPSVRDSGENKPNGGRKDPKVRGTDGTDAASSSGWSRPKDLKDGRKDTIATQVNLPVPQGSMLITVRTTTDYPVVQARIRVEIQVENVGWQNVSVKAQTVSEEGEYRVTGLFPGTYRVSCSLAGFADAEETVVMPGGMQEVQVKLVMGSPTWGRIGFSFTYEDGGEPQQVHVQRAELGARDGAMTGRFGSYGGSPNELGAVNSSISNYAIPQDGDKLLIFAVRVGMREQFSFSAARDTRRYKAEMQVTGKLNEEQRHPIVLKLLDANAPDPTGGFLPKEPVKVEVTFTRSDGAAVTLKRCNARLTPEAATYNAASKIEGNKATFNTLPPGNWYFAAEAEGINAPWVRQITITDAANLNLMIELGQVTISTAKDSAALPPEGTRFTYRIGLKPLGSGALESFFMREIPNNAQSDSVTYTIPAGQYTVAMGSNDQLLACEPPSASLTMTNEGNIAMNFTLRTACTLEFMAVDAYTTPVPGVEFLISFNPAGSITDTEKSRIQIGGADGRCKSVGAVYGQVYLHIWSTSKDLQAPDKSFQIELPSYGSLNLGALTVK